MNNFNRSPYTFLAFGHGPRNCIGMRFALYEAKLGLIALLSKYKMVKTHKTPETITLDPKAILSASKHPIWVKLEKRN